MFEMDSNITLIKELQAWHSSVSLDAHSGQKLLIESERFNNTPPCVPFTIEEEIFGPQYEGVLDRSIPYRNIQLT
ncbi:7138_t:CDS:2, partial [Rhizophagus irregularis]